MLKKLEGSVVLVIIPPLPPETVQRVPITLRYQNLTARGAARHQVPTIDAPALFRERDDGSPLFSDPVHPTALGHKLLAEELFRRLEPMLPGEFSRPPTGRAPTLESIQPPALPALREETIAVRGSRIELLAPFDQIWIGRSWIRQARFDGERLLLGLHGHLAGPSLH